MAGTRAHLSPLGLLEICHCQLTSRISAKPIAEVQGDPGHRTLGKQCLTVDWPLLSEALTLGCASVSNTKAQSCQGSEQPQGWMCLKPANSSSRVPNIVPWDIHRHSNPALRPLHVQRRQRTTHLGWICCKKLPRCDVQIMHAWQLHSWVPRYLNGWKLAIDRLEHYLWP